jgi:hypothetical protein
MSNNSQTGSVIKDGLVVYPNQVGEYSKMVQNNEEFDQTPLSNKLDKYLIDEFFPGFPVEMVPKSKLLENEKYQAFESPFFTGKSSGLPEIGESMSGKLNKLAALSGESSSEGSEMENARLYRAGGDAADGYKTFAWAFPGNSEDDEIRSYFPETDVFVYAIYSGNLNSSDYGKESSFSCNIQLLMYKRGDKRNHKSFQFMGNKNIEDYSFEKYVSEPDLEAIYSVREACLDAAIEKMKANKEKRIKQFQKWLDK